jgi:hypothetical protein
MDEQQRDRPTTDPGPETPDPAPWLGQVGEGSTEPSGEAIARAIRETWHPDDQLGDIDTEAEKRISSDPEMPIPDPDAR